MLFKSMHGFLLPIVCSLLMLAAGCRSEKDASVANSPKLWRFAIEEAEGSVQHAYALKFKELIEERSDGKIEVTVYPYGTLGTSTHLTEQLNMGVIQFAMASPGSLGKFIPELQVFLLPFLLPDTDADTRALLSDPEMVGYLDQLYAPKGLELLSLYSEGEMVWTVSKEIRQPEDFAGVKMRVMTSPILLAAYKAYGASPTPMPYSEVYSGLQLNMIDGQVNPVFAIERQKFHEVTSWMIFPRHLPFVTTCAASRDFFRNLPEPQQQLVREVVLQLDDYIFDVQRSYQSERLKVILRDKRRQRSELNIVGDLSPFVDSLNQKERTELIENNPYLNVNPELSEQEREAFQKLAKNAWEVFIEVGGPRSRELLDKLRLLSQAPAD